MAMQTTRKNAENRNKRTYVSVGHSSYHKDSMQQDTVASSLVVVTVLRNKYNKAYPKDQF